MLRKIAKFDDFWPLLVLFGLFLKLLELPGAAPGAGGTGELKKNAEFKKKVSRFFNSQGGLIFFQMFELFSIFETL